MARGERIAIGSIGIGCLVLGLKGAAWWLTGSVALYSDALESTVNVAASLLALGALHFAAIPAGRQPPLWPRQGRVLRRGHRGRADRRRRAVDLRPGLEHLAQSAFAGDAGRGHRPERGRHSAERRLVVVLLRTGRRLRSPALEADGRHLLADVVTSVGIALGVALAVVTGRLVLDPLLAAATGVYVLWSGMAMISSSVGGLMDAAPQPAVVNRIRELVAESAPARWRRTICAPAMPAG